MSATAIRNKPLAELYIGGAGDEVSRIVLSYARARAAAGARPVEYFPHYAHAAARRTALDLAGAGHRLALIGHSWGADTVLRVAGELDGQAFWLVGADPVAKPALPFLALGGSQSAARGILHITARAEAPDRSDFVRAAGYVTGGGVPRAFRQAGAHIRTHFNHWNFEGMMRAPGEDGRSAEDWLAALDTQGAV
ncbi:MAG: hypothetical protein ACK4SV_13685 [Hyphomonas sp.]